jgi:hypothetical protein
MLSPTVRTRPALAIFSAITVLLGAGCAGSGGGDQSSGFRLTFTSGTLSAASEVVFLRLRNSAGSLLTLDIVGRSITPSLNGLDLALNFDPSVLEALAFSDATFLGTCGLARPDNTILLCADSIGSGIANSSGVAIFSALPNGPAPVPSVVAGEVTLASVTFRAIAKGLSPIYFHDLANPAPGGIFSAVISGVDPQAAAAVLFDPDVPGSAEIEVRRR